MNSSGPLEFTLCGAFRHGIVCMSVNTNIHRKAVRVSLDKLLQRYWYWLISISEPHMEILLKQVQFELLRVAECEPGVRKHEGNTENVVMVLAR